MQLLDYLRNDSAHRQCTFIKTSDGAETIRFEGVTYSVEEFNKAFPRISDRLLLWDNTKKPSENPDTTRRWLTN